MSLTEEKRINLANRARESFGEESGTTLMEYLPPVGWADVATKKDLETYALLTKTELDSQTALLRTDLASQSALLRADIENRTIELRAEIDQLRTEVRAEIEQLRTELRAEIEQLRTEVRAEINQLRIEMDLKFAKMEEAIVGRMYKVINRWATIYLVAMVGAVLAMR